MTTSVPADDATAAPARACVDLKLLAARHDYAILTVVGLANGGTRARTVLTVAAAQRIVENAQRRGCAATVVLVRLTPVNVSPDVLAALMTGEAQ